MAVGGVLPQDERAVAGVVDRPHLYRQLDARDPRICVIRAASGAGKTTLLRGWAVRRAGSDPLVWLTISARIGSVAVFWTRISEAAERAGVLDPRTSQTLIQRLSAEPDPTDPVIEFMVDAGPVTLVLDNYEKVGDIVGEIDEQILRVVDALPQVRVVVAARGGTRLAEDALLIRGRVRIIGDRDLALSEPEVAELLDLHLPTVPPGAARRVTAATGGYALAVRALILSLAHGGAMPAGGSYGWGDLVAADLRSQLPDPSIARFVSLTSVPPYFDVALASRITGRRDVPAVLTALEHQGFGRWIPYAHRRPVFQYVEAVRETFTTELRGQYPAGYRKAASAAARWLFEHQDYEPAFEYAVIAENYPLAVEIFLSLVRTHPEAYLSVRFLGTLERIPHRALRAYPLLATALGLAQASHPVLRSSAPASFRIAARPSVDMRILGTDVDRFLAAGLRALSLRLSSQFHEAARQSLRAIAELDRLPESSRQESREPVAMFLLQLGYTLLQGGRYDDALAAFTRAVALDTDRAARNYALGCVAGTHGFLGNPIEARSAVSQIDADAWPPHHRESYLNVMTLVGEGFVALDEGDPDAALGCVERARRYGPMSEFWPFVTAVSLHAHLLTGHGLEEASRVDEQLGAPFPPPGSGSNVGTRATLNLLAIAWLAGGRLARAERILAEQPHPELIPARLVHALVTDRRGIAADRLLGWLTTPGRTVRGKAAALVLGAAVMLRRHDHSLAATLLRQADDVQRRHGAAAHLDLVPVPDRAALLELAGSAGITSMVTAIQGRRPAVIPGTIPVIALTKREVVVLEALASGASRTEIAARLSVSTNTLKSQLGSIYRKLGVTTRGAALRAALEHELIGRVGLQG